MSPFAASPARHLLTQKASHRLSFHELKIAAVQDLMTLRSRGVVSQADNFQAILDSIAQDIKLKRE